ncbi:hypothetical protein [Brevundimonas sp. SL161]|uniref:hypothetical protein n=1 Tax=Brevundimonas sp. SL161 TaxID=2804613 RepID=UPI003CE686F8
MNPNYQTNAPQGYCGDWTRGAPMGRPSIAPESRSLAELEGEFVAACQDLDRAMRLKENRPSDGWKASAWEAAARDACDRREEYRVLIKSHGERVAASPKVTLRKVRLDSGGYDPEGAYWGHGEALYWAATDDGSLDMTLRASNRDDARAQVRDVIPGARFFR